MDIELDGKCVIHKTFGKGSVLSFDGRYLEVDFSDACKKCKFQFPSCFYGYLRLEDDEMKKVIEPMVERWKEENEIDRKEELKLKHQKTMQEIEERRQEAERKKHRAALRNAEHKFIQKFEKGDLVLYGNNGLCDITDVATVDIPGIDKDRLYYILSARNSKCTIYVAADGDLSKMRKLISKEEAKDLVSKIREIEPLKLRDEKKPDAEYKEALQKYDCIELFKLIKCIYFRRKQRLDEGKKVTAADDKYMHHAEDMLYQELGVVLDIPKDQVLDYIIKEIEGNI